MLSEAMKNTIMDYCAEKGLEEDAALDVVRRMDEIIKDKNATGNFRLDVYQQFDLMNKLVKNRLP